MKITQIEVIPVQAPGRTLVPVLVHTDEGIVGLGEAGLQRRWKGIQGVAEHFSKWLVGQDPRRIDYLWQRMFRGGFYPADRLVGSLISAIDIALWDIKGKMLGVPIYELLGGRVRDHVEVFTTPRYGLQQYTADAGDLLKGLDSADPAAWAELASRCAEAGHRYFRMGMPKSADRYESRRSIRQLVTMLKAVRDRVGDRLELMIDAHTRLSPDEAVWFCREIEDLQMFCVEDPIRSEHMHGYEHLRRSTRVPLAAGEQWANRWEFRQCIEGELLDFIRPDICICGGITEAKKIAAMAEVHMIRTLMHNPLGPVCTAASLHIDLACDNAGPQEVLFPPETTLPDVFECAFRIEHMRLSPPTAPGLGVSFNRDAARRYPAGGSAGARSSRPDGSFTNY
jgi:L-alanine-DL-glutamate epimerase-like enolase superfamily enzyme